MVKKEVMAALLLSGSNKNRYGRLMSTLAQHMSMGTIQYPHTVEDTMNILNTCSKTAKVAQKNKPSSKSVDQHAEVVFAQSNINKKPDFTITDIISYNCGKIGIIKEIIQKKQVT